MRDATHDRLMTSDAQTPSMRSVAAVVDAVQTMEGEGMVVRRAIPNSRFRMVDPFLLLDHMGPKTFGPGQGKGAPDHPHRGFETVTYILDGRLQHKDSQGNVGDLNAGDVQWMTAGAGVVHSEMPHPEMQKTGGVVHGLQLWVNLPAADKMMAPRYQDIASADIPEVSVPGGHVRVIAGAFQGTQAVIDTRTPITYLHVLLDGGDVTLPVPAGHNGFLYATSGQGRVAGHDIHEGQIAALHAEGDAVAVSASGPLSILLVTGKPLNEPVFQWGPFVMTSREEIAQAVNDYQEGRMGRIPATVG